MTLNRIACAAPLIALSVSACSILPHTNPPDHTAEQPAHTSGLPANLPPGAREVLNRHLDPKPDHHLIVTDVVLAPNAQLPAHYHPADELAYIIEGSIIHIEEGKPDRNVNAGEMLIIPALAVHAPKAGPGGTRGIIIRLNKTGDPVTVPVPESDLVRAD